VREDGSIENEQAHGRTEKNRHGWFWRGGADRFFDDVNVGHLEVERAVQSASIGLRGASAIAPFSDRTCNRRAYRGIAWPAGRFELRV
jgi:hypothetical protein